MLRTADLAGEFDVFQRGEVLDEVVKLEYETHVMAPVFRKLPPVIAADYAAVELYGALVAGVHAAEHIQYGRLPRAARADDDAELALLNGKSAWSTAVMVTSPIL